jgi:hypothetical protein
MRMVLKLGDLWEIYNILYRGWSRLEQYRVKKIAQNKP